MKQVYFLIGAPGSGKTTAANLVAQKHSHIAHYSAGDMLRAEVATGSELGNKIDNIISQGEIVPVELINHSIESTINAESASTILIDGFPRSMEQMQAFDALLKKNETMQLSGVIEVTVSDETAKERVLGRALESEEVRNDDNERVFANRMAQYTKPLKAIQDFYNEKALHKYIDAEQDLNAVVGALESLVN